MKFHSKPSASKKNVVKEFAQLLLEYPIIGSVNMANLPASQLQTLRTKLRQTVEMRMTKKRLITIAIDQVKDKKPGIEKLLPYLKGMPALLFTKENPFALYKIIKKSKSPAPAKGGQEAPKDIVVPAGPTPFVPGPIIGELGMFGIKSKVEGGKITVISDTTVVKEGDIISLPLAALLTRLGINPMEMGLDLVALYENGEIIEKSVLDIDETQYYNNITTCAKWAFNLAIEAAWPTLATTELLVQRAFRQARSLSLEAGISTKDTISDLIGLAQRQAAAIGQHIITPEGSGESSK